MANKDQQLVVKIDGIFAEHAARHNWEINLEGFNNHKAFKFFLDHPSNRETSKNICKNQHFWYCAYLHLLRNFVSHHPDDAVELDYAFPFLPPDFRELSLLRRDGKIKVLQLYWRV